jgi:hypothetical protein
LSTRIDGLASVGARVRPGFVFGYHLFSIRWLGSFWVCFGFVFSTGTCFQALPSFVFGFVWVCFFRRSIIINNFPALFFKKGILFLFFAPESTLQRRNKAITLGHALSSKIGHWVASGAEVP